MADLSQKALGIVIVSWNVREALLANLRSVFESSTKDFEVIVVDNDSSDGTVEAVRAAFPIVQIIENHDNLGFAKACNQGIAASHARHVLLLNPDMRVAPDALEKTIEYLDSHPDVAVLGPKLIGEDGQAIPHIRRFPRVAEQLAVIFKLTHVFPRLMDRYLMKDADLNQEQDVDSLRGSYFAINETALKKIGNLDERFFIWFEEVDYCRRVRVAGMRVRYVPSIVAHDSVGKSFAQRPMYWKQRVMARSMSAYFSKWHSKLGALCIRAAWSVVLPLAWLATKAGLRSPAKPKA